MRGSLPLQPVTGPQPEGCPSRPNTDPKLLNQFEMFCTWVCRLLTVSIRAGSSVRTLFKASTSTFFSCAVMSGRSCIMLSSWA